MWVDVLSCQGPGIQIVSMEEIQGPKAQDHLDEVWTPLRYTPGQSPALNLVCNGVRPVSLDVLPSYSGARTSSFWILRIDDLARYAYSVGRKVVHTQARVIRGCGSRHKDRQV